MATRHYVLPPRDQSGVLLGLSMAQLFVIGVGGLATLAMTKAASGVLSVLPLFASYGVAKARAGGLLWVEWVPVIWHWVRVRRSLDPSPVLGDGDISAAISLKGISLEDIGDIGAVRNRSKNTLTAVIAVEAPTVNALLPDDEIAQLYDGWGTVLATHAKLGSPVARIGWTEICRTASEEDHISWVDSLDVERDDDLCRDYLKIVRKAAPTTTSHTVYVSVVVDAARLTRSHWSASVNNTDITTDDRLAEALRRSVRVTNEALRKAELKPRVLASDQVAEIVNSAIDPDYARAFAPRVGGLSQRLGLTTNPGPTQQQVTPSWYDTDHVLHRSYQVFEWPRQPLNASWLLNPVVLPLTSRRFTVWFTPVEVRESYQRINRELSKLEADAMTAVDKGKRITAVSHRAVEAAQDREAELVDGFAETDFVGVITISRSTPEGLVADCEAFEAEAMQAGIQLRALDRQHDLGWAASLPLGIPAQQGSFI